MHASARRDNWVISTDPNLLDLAVIHGFLSRSYWAAGIPLEVAKRSLQNCLPFGVYDTSSGGHDQVGLARVITDRATFAYLGDVFILEPYRGKGLSKWLMEVILAHPELQGLRRWMLLTRDAHGLYRRSGFTAPAHPEMVMERRFPDVYRAPAQTPAPPSA